jgi:PPP family 3-phenylpropionic acid transporter
MKRSLPFTFYLFYFAALSFLAPFFILYFQEMGFNGTQIGILASSIPLVIMVGAPFWTGLADAKNRHKLVMSGTLVGVVIVSAIIPLFKDFLPVLILSILSAFFASPVISLADSATMSILGNEKDLYGRVRLGGTIGWGLTALIAGYVIQTYGPRWVFWGYALIMVCVWFITRRFTYPQRVENQSTGGDLRSMVFNHSWIVFLILSFLAGIGLTTFNSFLSPYLQELGISQTFMGIALTISTISELPVLFYSNYFLRRFGAYQLVLLAIAITGIRLVLYAAFNSIVGILVFQLLNGLTFPLFWVAAVSYANEISPEGMKATGQGLLGAVVSGIGAAIGGMLCGLLIGNAGGYAMFLSIGITLLASVITIGLLESKRIALLVHKVD